jgi:hypothetical protein
MKPRYMIKIEVVEIGIEGQETDIHERYATELAIEDAQEADMIARDLLLDANRAFRPLHDSSPVTPGEATNGQ